MLHRDHRGGGPPHAILLAAVVVAVMVVPSILSDQGEAITEFISELLSPVGLLLLPIGLVLVIHLLSSSGTRAVNSVYYAGEPDSIHRVGGSPVGVALVLALVLMLLYFQISIFGGGDGDGDDGED